MVARDAQLAVRGRGRGQARARTARAPERECLARNRSDEYEPILGEIELDNGNTALSAQGWCEGFSRGVDLRARLWETRLGADSQLTEVLGPIMALAVEEGVFATDAEFSPLSEEEYDECLGQLPGVGQRGRAVLARISADAG